MVKKMKHLRVLLCLSALSMLGACATDTDIEQVTDLPEQTRETAANTESLEPHEIDHFRLMDEDIERLNHKLASEEPDPAWQAQVREYFHGEWKNLHSEETGVVFTQDFVCSVNVCAARVELPSGHYIKSIHRVMSQRQVPSDEELWGRCATRPEHGDDLQVWIFLWRKGAER